MVTFLVWVRKTKHYITVYLVPGRVTLLAAQPCLEGWGMAVDHHNKRVMPSDDTPHVREDIVTNEKGHTIIHLLNFPEDALEM
eukprot:7126294-Pyramimonas_sp.AAC.1